MFWREEFSSSVVSVFQEVLSHICLLFSARDMCDARAVVWVQNFFGWPYMEKLEKIQAEVAKRILKWPKHFSNAAAISCNNEM